ncbi:hypothetical protein DMH25_08225 [Streptomyces sp. WAC 01325]|uniref:hypothetical protein n=1 Tax=Streptomyces sp. WAC 01325 TaxID=2203202 RepID=UPI000F85DF95|nr:hypothetical protein [Streptomyces sp. WAC 01325]RSN13765.1 hypothetical protein DMH25_08225 [Streptomyces sp. WAC 01325]
MNDFTLDEQQLEALRPLAAVIEGAIKDTPIRLGTDDWGTMLAAGILVRVAAYMGGVLPPAAEAGDWLMRGTRDLSIPEQAPAADEGACLTHIKGACDGTTRDCVRATNDDSLRFLRREALLVLLTRLQRGRALTDAEANTLRHHVETEIREADAARKQAEQAEELQRVAHETANRSETERARYEQEAVAATEATEPGTSSLRDQIAAAIYERNNPGYRWSTAHPDDRLAYGFDADAVLAVIAPTT